MIAVSTADREFALLAMVTARPVVPPGSSAALQAVRHGRIDWSRFLALVERHRIAPLAFDGMKQIQPLVPVEVYRRLRIAATRDRADALRLIGVLSIVTTRLTAVGIEALTIKGPTLSLLAFGDASLRQCKDLDILIPLEHVSDALRVLTEGDFRLIRPAGVDRPDRLAMWAQMMKDVSLLHEPTGALVELHWRLNENPHLLAGAVEWSRRPVAIGSVHVETLAPRDLLLYLCVHGAEHFWLRLKWLADVHALLAGGDADGIVAFYEDACACQLGVPAGQMLLMLELVYGLPLPASTRAAAWKSARTRLVTRLSLKTLRAIAEPGATRFGTTRLVAGHMLLRPNPRYVAREALSLVIDWPVALGMSRSRWAFVIAIAGRPFFWIVRKLRSR